MKQLIAAVTICCLLVVASCSHGPKNKIIGSWKGSKFENADMDSFFAQSQRYIDTVGKNNNMKTNWELYGVTNIDSLRKVLQMQHDSAKSMQVNGVLNTVFTFKKDSLALISFNGSLDTSKWYLEKDSVLVMEEMTGNEKGSVTRIGILTLSDNELKLRFQQEGSFSTVTFVKSPK